MGKVIPLAPFRQAPSSTSSSPALDEGLSSAADHELAPIAALLFVAGLARVAHALWVHEPFDVEPTLAAACVVGIPWLAWLGRRKHP